MADLLRVAPPVPSREGAVTAAVARTKGGSVSSEAREKSKQAGHAMPDGSFPIEDSADLDNAIQSVGRAKDPEAARRHIIKQAKRLGLESKIPDSWNADGSVTASAGRQDADFQGEVIAVITADGEVVDMDSLVAVGPKGYTHGWKYVGGPGLPSAKKAKGSGGGNEGDKPDAKPFDSMSLSELRAERDELQSKRRTPEETARYLALVNEIFQRRSGNRDRTVTASVVLNDGQREALTAAVGALVDKLGPVGAHGIAPQVFQTPDSLEFVDSLIELPDADEGLTAAATTELPSIDLFTPPRDLPPGTGHYVDHEPLPNGLRRVYGRLAEWDIPHIGIDGQKIYPPRSPSGYRWFHTKSAWVQGPNGPERIKVGHLTFGTGHAPMGVNHLAAAAHYDNSGHRGAKIRMSEDEYGPVYAGVTVAGLEGARLEEFGESDVSGDWRRPIGPLDLVATLCVNVGGYPKVGLSLAASGEPLALVASAKAWGNPAAVVDVEAIAAAVVSQMERRKTLTTRRDSLLAALDDSPERMAVLLDELDDDLGDDEIAFIDGTPDQTGSEIDNASSVLTAAAGRRGENWVEQTGTGHLPRYIKRISKHLRSKGMTESRAIATAVNVVKRMCSTGDLNFKGAQQVNAKSRAEACAAVTEWEAKKAQARAT